MLQMGLGMRYPRRLALATSMLLLLQPPPRHHGAPGCRAAARRACVHLPMRLFQLVAAAFWHPWHGSLALPGRLLAASQQASVPPSHRSSPHTHPVAGCHRCCCSAAAATAACCEAVIFQSVGYGAGILGLPGGHCCRRHEDHEDVMRLPAGVGQPTCRCNPAHALALQLFAHGLLVLV